MLSSLSISTFQTLQDMHFCTSHHFCVLHVYNSQGAVWWKRMLFHSKPIVANNVEVNLPLHENDEILSLVQGSLFHVVRPPCLDEWSFSWGLYQMRRFSETHWFHIWSKASMCRLMTDAWFNLQFIWGVIRDSQRPNICVTMQPQEHLPKGTGSTRSKNWGCLSMRFKNQHGSTVMCFEQSLYLLSAHFRKWCPCCCRLQW